MTAKRPIDSNIQELSSEDPNGIFILTWHTGLVLAKSKNSFKFFTFEKPKTVKIYDSILRLGPRTPGRPKDYKQGALDAGIQENLHAHIALVIPTSCTSSKTAMFFP